MKLRNEEAHFVTYYLYRFFLQTVNPFHATGLFLYPLKTSENKRYRKRV